MKIQIEKSDVKKTYQAEINFPEGFEFTLMDTPIKERVNDMIKSRLEQSLCCHKTSEEHWELVKGCVELLAKENGHTLLSVGFTRNPFKKEFNHLFAVLEQINS
jgi:hypothetical protein